MKAFSKIFALLFILVFAFSSVSLVSVSADNIYTQPEKFIYGDVNLDGKITIKDATLIQKDLAKISLITTVQKFLATPERNGYSIKNATAIQKYLAQYETEIPWGEKIVMASQDEFSKRFSIEDDYKDDCIIIGVNQIEGFNYTLQDFPEYKFKSIEVLAEFNNIKKTCYILHLENPGKENVIEAIKALDYRANIDLLWVEPNFIYHVEFD